MRRRPVDPAVRAEALRLADEVGSAEAARRLGISAGTVRGWRSRAPKPAPAVASAASERPSEASAEVVTGDELRSLARQLLANAAEAQKAVTRALRAGKLTQGYHGSLSSAISIDKIAGIIEAIDRLGERNAQDDQVQLDRMKERLVGLFTELGRDPYTDREVNRLIRRWFDGDAPEIAVSPARAITAPAEAEQQVTAEVVAGGSQECPESEGIRDAEVVEVPPPTGERAEQDERDLAVARRRAARERAERADALNAWEQAKDQLGRASAPTRARRGGFGRFDGGGRGGRIGW